MTLRPKTAAVAVWAITQRGAELGRRLADALPGARLLVSGKVRTAGADEAFDRLHPAVGERFGRYTGHVFIMSAGIVVRMIAGLLVHKTTDPAVVVMDERGRHAVSLLSGHLGGANRLTQAVADAVGADPVITTATDVNDLPSIDLVAQQLGLVIENPGAIRHVNMAILAGEPVYLHDPMACITSVDPETKTSDIRWLPFHRRPTRDSASPGVFVDDILMDLSPATLVLRPPTLAAGIGCNRGTGEDEMRDLLQQVLNHHRLAVASLRAIASVDLKRDEAGLIALARGLRLPLRFYSREQLGGVATIQNPSVTVEKHIGVKSVCEAAAILATEMGRLIVPKTNTRNVTVAVARVACPSSASGRAAWTTSPNGPGRCSMPPMPWRATRSTST